MSEVDVEELLRQLRWKEDMLITNDFGELVWLKPLFVDGKRIGITDCCFEEEPCEWHAVFRDKGRTPARGAGDERSRR